MAYEEAIKRLRPIIDSARMWIGIWDAMEKLGEAVVDTLGRKAIEVWMEEKPRPVRLKHGVGWSKPDLHVWLKGLLYEEFAREVEEWKKKGAITPAEAEALKAYGWCVLMTVIPKWIELKEKYKDENEAFAALRAVLSTTCAPEARNAFIKAFEGKEFNPLEAYKRWKGKG